MKNPGTKTRGKRGSAATAAAPAATSARGGRTPRNSNPNGGVGTQAQAEYSQSTAITASSKKRIATMKQSIALARKMGDTLAKQVEQNSTLLEMLETEQKQLEAA